MNGWNSSRGLLLILAGLPGVGKSTLARLIKSNLPAYRVVILESDRTRKQLFSTPTYSQEETREVQQAMIKKSVEHLAKGDIVIYDAAHTRQKDREAALGAARIAACPHIMVQVVADEDLVKRRLQSQGDGERGHSDATLEIHRELKDSFQPISDEHILVCGENHFERDLPRLLGRIRKHIKE